MPPSSAKTELPAVQPIETKAVEVPAAVSAAPRGQKPPEAQSNVVTTPKDASDSLKLPASAPNVAGQAPTQSRPAATQTSVAATKTSASPMVKTAGGSPATAGASSQTSKALSSRDAMNRDGQPGATRPVANGSASQSKTSPAMMTAPSTATKALPPRPQIPVQASQMPSKPSSSQPSKNIDRTQTPAPTSKVPGARPPATAAPLRPPTGQRLGAAPTGPGGPRPPAAAAVLPGNQPKLQVAQAQNVAARPIVANQPSKAAGSNPNGHTINGNGTVRPGGPTPGGTQSMGRPVSTFSTSTPLQRTLELQARAAAAGSQMNININAAQQQQRLQMQMQQQKQKQQLSAIAQQQHQRSTIPQAQTGNHHSGHIGPGSSVTQTNIDRDVKDEAENERTRLENRERKKRWREANEDRNKDNDLRCRVNKRAHKLFGKEASKTKDLWIEEEFTKRKSKRQEKEGKGPDGHPLVEGVDLINLNPFEMCSVIMATLLEYVCGPVAAATAPKDDPELVSLMKTLQEEPEVVRTLLLGNNNAQSFAMGNGKIAQGDDSRGSPLTTYNMNKMNGSSNDDTVMRDQPDDDDDDDLDDDQDMDMDMDMDDADSSQDNSSRTERIDPSAAAVMPRQENNNEGAQVGSDGTTNARSQSGGPSLPAAVGSLPARRLSISSAGNDNYKFSPYQDSSWNIEPQFALALSSDLFRLAVARSPAQQALSTGPPTKGPSQIATANSYKPQANTTASAAAPDRPTLQCAGPSGLPFLTKQEPVIPSNPTSPHNTKPDLNPVNLSVNPTKSQVSDLPAKGPTSQKLPAKPSMAMSQSSRPTPPSLPSASASASSRPSAQTFKMTSPLARPPVAVDQVRANIPPSAKVHAPSPGVPPGPVKPALKAEENSPPVPEKEGKASLAPEATIKKEIET